MIKKSMIRKFLPKLLIIIGVLFAAVVFAAGTLIFYIMQFTKPLTLEAGEPPELSSITENSLLSAICKIDTSAVSTEQIGNYEIQLEFFEGITLDVPVYVRDTVPPELELYKVFAVIGTELECADFVKASSDLTEVTTEFENGAPDTSKSGVYEVAVRAVDSSGNATVKFAVLEVADTSDAINVELGSSDCSDEIYEKYPNALELELSEVKLDVPGRYTARMRSEDEYRILMISVADTIPPEGETVSGIFRKGTQFAAETLVTEIFDVSEVSVSFAEMPNVMLEGIHDIELALEDSAGNRTLLKARYGIYNVPEKIKMEYGFSKMELEEALFKNVSASVESQLSLDGDFSVGSFDVGVYEIMLKNELGEMSVELTVRDDEAPELVLNDVSVYLGTAVDINDFISSCTDASPVEFSFGSDFDVNTAGLQKVTIIATDSSGNSTEKQTYLQILVDNVPPVIYGVKNLSIIAGETVSYKSGVYAIDDTDGYVEVTVDTSNVNTSIEGVYTITYTAVDSFGNKAKKSATLTVRGITQETLNQLADEILAKIVTSAMTPRERAWAIYSWCTANLRYSTRTSYLMGNYLEGAYSGLKIKSGNCYIYYAVARTLLTRTGIENIEIQRNDPNNPHYWNLVKIDDNWYHFDTCPHYAGHALTSFLLTDAEVKAYSENEVKGYYSFDSSLYPATP